MIHLLAFGAANTTTYPTALTPITNDIFPISGNAFLIPQDLWITSVAVTGLNVNRVELHFQPESAAADLSIIQLNSGQANPGSNAGIFLPAQPIAMPKNQPLTVNASASTGTPFNYCLVEVSDTPTIPVEPVSPPITLRFSSTTASSPRAWTQLVPTWEIPSLLGNYVVSGMHIQGLDAIAMRCYNPSQSFRPGCLGVGALSYLSHPYFGFRGNRSLLQFNGASFPSIEVLSDLANVANVGYLIVHKVG